VPQRIIRGQAREPLSGYLDDSCRNESESQRDAAKDSKPAEPLVPFLKYFSVQSSLYGESLGAEQREQTEKCAGYPNEFWHGSYMGQGEAELAGRLVQRNRTTERFRRWQWKHLRRPRLYWLVSPKVAMTIRVCV
jgi:hypothetical protein